MTLMSEFQSSLKVDSFLVQLADQLRPTYFEAPKVVKNPLQEMMNALL